MKTRIASVAALLLAASAFAQETLNRQIGQDYLYDYNSGVLGNPGQEFVKVAQTVVAQAGASWQRILFSNLQLEGESYIIMTSLKDGEFQKFDAETAAMWSNGSAYFNGDKILVEVYAAPGTMNNKVVVNKISAEMPPLNPEGDPGQCGICGSDNRIVQNNDAVGRLMNVGCTATIYCRSSGMVTAGHCLNNGTVVHFRVPASNANCTTNVPGVADQFPVLNSAGVNGGVGNDYGTLRMGTNSLGETPYHRYNVLFPIGAPPIVGDTINYWGYGVDTNCVRSQVSQFSAGSVFARSGTRIDFDADLRGGNSGSSLLNPGLNPTIAGIITHCSNGGVCDNIGTTINHPNFITNRAAVNPACNSTLLLLNVQTSGASGVPITLSAADVNSLQNGTSNFKRVYASGSSVSFTAPATSGGLCFTGWTLNGSAVAGNPATISVTADGTMVANYGSCGPTPPPNNNCGSAIDVSAGGTFNGTLVAATNDGTASCGGSGANPDVWYSYTNTTCNTRELTVTTCGSNTASGIDTVLSFHTACGGSQIACIDDTSFCTGFGTLDSALSTSVAPGATVKIRVSKFSSAPLLPFILNVSSTSNDACANAALVPAGSYAFCNVGATTDGPGSCGAMGSDLWYRYTATASGLVTVKTCGSSFDSVVAVYADGCPAGAAITCNDDDFNAHCSGSYIRDAWTQFNATAGTTYLIAVGGFAGSSGNGTLTIERFCSADFNGDGALDFFDYLDFVDAFSANAPTADFNGDGSIDFFDYLDFVDAFSTGC